MFIHLFVCFFSVCQNMYATDLLVCKVAESKMQPSQPHLSGTKTMLLGLPDLGTCAVAD